MLILRTLQWAPQHGHGIGQAIRQQSDELLKIETGSLYPALHRLVKRGWLKADWGVSDSNQKAKFYRLTRCRQGPIGRRARSLGATRGRDRPGDESGGGQKGIAMRPDDHELNEEIRGRISRSASRNESNAARIRRPPAARRSTIRLHPGRPRGNAARLVQPLVRRRRSACAGHQGRHPLAAARQRPGRHRRDHARARHRRQRGDLQRRPRRAAASARQSRRGSLDLHPAERARPRHREHDVLGGRDTTTSRRRATSDRRLRRLLDHRLHDAWRRRAARAARRRRRRVVLRCDGLAAGAGPAAECLRTTAARRPAWWS